MADKQRISPQMSGIAYVPRILRTMAEICEAMGVGQKTVKKWVEQGAPIAVEGTGCKLVYSAESASLQAWRILQAQACAEAPDEGCGMMRQSSDCLAASTMETS